MSTSVRQWAITDRSLVLCPTPLRDLELAFAVLLSYATTRASWSWTAIPGQHAHRATLVLSGHGPHVGATFLILLLDALEREDWSTVQRLVHQALRETS